VGCQFSLLEGLAHTSSRVCIVSYGSALTFLEIVGLIPQEDLFKMNIDMPGPFWHDWEWRFGHPFT